MLFIPSCIFQFFPFNLKDFLSHLVQCGSARNRVFSFCLTGDFFHLPPFLRDNSATYGILDWQIIFPLSTLAMPFHSLFLKDFFFFTWAIFEVFIEFVTILLLFYILVFFWPWGMWDLISLTRDQIHILALESEVLTIGPPGKSLCCSTLFPWALVTSWASLFLFCRVSFLFSLLFKSCFYVLFLAVRLSYRWV